MYLNNLSSALCGAASSLAVAGLCLALATPANATVVTFQQGAGGYAGNQDAELRQNSPNTNFGGGPTMTIDTADPAITHALLRFDGIVGGGLGQIPLGATIVSADLQLFVDSGGNNINMLQMLLNWNEAAATWNNLGGDGNGVSNPGEAMFLRTLIGRPTPGSPLFDSGETQIFDVATEVQSWASGASNFGWGFVPTDNDGVDFATSENGAISNRPKLTVNFRVSPVPEPATLTLFGLGLAGLGLARRRRKSAA